MRKTIANQNQYTNSGTSEQVGSRCADGLYRRFCLSATQASNFRVGYKNIDAVVLFKFIVRLLSSSSVLIVFSFCFFRVQDADYS